LAVGFFMANIATSIIASGAKRTMVPAMVKPARRPSGVST
jgi:uncharacterized protein YbcC (UPF0753/DUF2309 family)